ncbi:hypothetical protein DY000_02036203 [Brassica cretica]|uniref:F-box domain-containing protein n=1 Tax=Brassica cretica TaxID=69181 RepID=A0ABQ7B798_BRACR|nr:hypothetical protein DY000_02036203 [Brassica cretica]
MWSPERKRKKKPSLKQSLVLEPTPESTPNPSLPDDLVVSCLARVSRLQYPTLSLVSKSFRSLLASPGLYKTRSSLGHTESCLYVCIRFPNETNPRWFTLCQKPDRTLTTVDTTKKPSGYALAKLSTPHSRHAHGPRLSIAIPDSLARLQELSISPRFAAHLYKTRSSLGLTESCLYVCIRFPNETNPRWFTLCQKPDPPFAKKKKKSSGYALATIPIPHSPPAHWSGLVVGSIYKTPLSTVSVLDCQSHTWRESPSMLIERYYPAANVVDGKIYVTGGCEECDNSSWMEVFDPKTQTWELVPSHGPEICGCKIYKSAVIDEKLHMFGTQNGLAYKPREGRWERIWMKGLKGLPKFAHYGCVKLADYGGKMAVLWDKFLPSSGYKKKTIWCAVVALERPSNEEIFGKVEWLDAVLTVPEYYEFVCALVATV